MAEGTCSTCVYLSSLDPGVGKTMTLVEFIKQVVDHDDYDDVGVLVCLSRLSEVSRMVEEAGLEEGSFAVFTSDEGINRLSSTARDQAQVLFTTQQMLTRRCSGLAFPQCREFHYNWSPRAVRVWDETLEPGEVIALSTDDLGSLLQVLRPTSTAVADLAHEFLGQMSEGNTGTVLDVPVFDEGFLADARSRTDRDDIKRRLDSLSALSGRTVKVISGMGRQRIALDIRDAFPSDLAPLLVLDASGRVRQTYAQWEKQKGGLMRLQSAPKSYNQLTVQVLDQGGGKDSWQKNGDQLAMEVASVIDSKPGEPWLIVHHKDARGVDPKAEILSRVETDRDRVHFLHWGAHQATNDFKDIPNVILAGTLFIPESHYLGLAHASSGLSTEEELSKELVDEIRHGEHGHSILQALCRASVRGSDGPRCRPCNAYIIAAKGSGIRDGLRDWFPECEVKSWKPRHRPLKGRVAQAVGYLERRLKEDPAAVILFKELMDLTGETNKSNFNRTIRKPLTAVESLGLEEVAVDGSRHKNAWRRTFLPDPEGTYIADV